jgi:thiol-disulfide isomerase/thioredoxin
VFINIFKVCHKLLYKTQNLCNLGGRCEEGEACDDILEELENIDDELDEAGIIFVTTEDINLAKKHGIKTFPTLAFFRNKELLLYEGSQIYLLN